MPHFPFRLLLAVFLLGSPALVAAQDVPTIRTSWHFSDPADFSSEGPVPHTDAATAQAWLHDAARFHSHLTALDDWQDAHALVRSVLDAPTPLPSHRREQLAALMMLDRFLRPERVTPAQLEALGFYTALLVEHRSPEGALLVEALRALEGYWPAEKHRAAAQRATEGVAVYVERVLRCPRCAEQALQGHEVAATVDRSTPSGPYLAEMVEALQALHAMSR